MVDILLIAEGWIRHECVGRAWNVAETETIGFQVSARWDGPDFLAVVANPILRNGIEPTWAVKEGKCHSTICQPTHIKPIFSKSTPQEYVKEIFLKMSEERRIKLQKARIFVEFNSDDIILQNVSTVCCPQPVSCRKALKTRLANLYKKTITDHNFVELLEMYSSRWDATWAEVMIDDKITFSELQKNKL